MKRLALHFSSQNILIDFYSTEALNVLDALKASQSGIVGLLG